MPEKFQFGDIIRENEIVITAHDAELFLGVPNGVVEVGENCVGRGPRVSMGRCANRRRSEY
ncbi:hypothetical protein OK016_01265 [Vibrio chagasii]|nr:hypothetical protein [Vibrio chagasii]